MKTSAIEVHDMLSVFSVDEVEKRIGEVPGVESVTVNFAAGNATVRYDETRLETADIKSAVRQHGFESEAPAATSGSAGHEGHAAADAPPASPAPAIPIATPAVPVATEGEPPEKSAPSTIPDASPVEAAAAPAASVDGGQKDKTAPDKS